MIFHIQSDQLSLTIINGAVRYLAAEVAISQGSLCYVLESRAAGNPITPGHSDEPWYISGNGIRIMRIITLRYRFVTSCTTVTIQQRKIVKSQPQTRKIYETLVRIQISISRLRYFDSLLTILQLDTYQSCRYSFTLSLGK